MLEQELKNIWKNSSKSEKIKFSTSRLLMDLDRERNSIEKSIKIRDTTEISASIFGILTFCYFAFEIPFPLTKVACVLTIVWFIYLILRLKKNKKQKHQIDLTLSLREQLCNQKANMLREIRLLDNILYWYILPPLLANVLFIFSFGNPEDYNWFPYIIERLTEENLLSFLPISMHTKIYYLSGSILYCTFLFWINKRVIKKQFQPMVKTIERMQKQLESENLFKFQ